MPWTPSTSSLGTHAELASFNHTIQYYEEEADPLGGPSTQTYFPVTITPAQTYPSSVVITNGLNAAISGFFKRAFDDELTVRLKDGTFNTVTTMQEPAGDVFSKINRSTLSQVISFKADQTRSKTFTYTAVAKDGDVVLSTQSYTIFLQDKNWTPGMLALRELVSYTKGN